MMKITGLSHLFKWDNLHNWWLTKYFFAPLYMVGAHQVTSGRLIKHELCWGIAVVLAGSLLAGVLRAA